MTAWSLAEVPVPGALDAPDAWLLHGLVDAMNDVATAQWGHRDFCRTPRHVLAALHDQRFERRPRVVALANGTSRHDPARVLGYAAVDLPQADNEHIGYVELGVRPQHRARGIGSGLHDAALELARADGRSRLVGESDQPREPADGEPSLAPSTGSGRVGAADPTVRFARSHGWRLEQVERYSVLDVPLDPERLDRLRADAERAAGSDYRVVHWTGACPDRWVDDYALLRRRMSTDAPLGGIDWREDVWDEDRVRATEARYRERGSHLLVAAAEHVPSGTLAAFTVLNTLAHTDEYVEQDDTLVLREHRGRRLGMLVKAANLQRLAADRPATRRVGTWNAEENRWMLAINVALGFRPAGGSGEWQVEL